jgi:cell division protein ZapA
MNDEYFPNPIQLKIVDKYFPYSCRRKDEQRVRNAATNVTQKYMDYRSYYSGIQSSMVDLLKLVAFHFSLELTEDRQREDLTPFIRKIEQLNAELEQYIRKF